MDVQTALGALLLILKNACFNVTVALTVLVALGDEIRRWKIPLQLHWLQERHDELKRAWHISLGLYAVLAGLYAWSEKKPEALIVDAISLVLMMGAVWYLNRRRGAPRDSAPEKRPAAMDEEPDEFPAPRRPLDRVPRDRTRRVRRERREPAYTDDD